MDGEAGTTVADRSTAAVGVANEGAEEPPVALGEGATTDGPTNDGPTTDDRTDDETAEGGAEKAQDSSASDPGATVPIKEAGEGPGDSTGAVDGDGEAVEGHQSDAGELSGTTTQPLPEKPGSTASDAADAADGVATPAAADTAATTQVVGGAASPRTTAERKGSGNGSASAAARENGTARPAKPRTTAPEPHSGHKLARRYQLAECVTRVDGFSSWRAVDEKLRRAVGIHILPADHPRARSVLAAARSAALLGDPRFVQVLDAVEEGDLVYVIHEWLPDAASLGDLLAVGPLDPHEAQHMVSQVSQAMAAAHREGLSHLKLDPGAVLRTVSGQYRIRGLAVTAALRGLTADRPARQDTEAVGALLYASLTQRWPYEEDAHGLAGLPKGVGLIAPTRCAPESTADCPRSPCARWPTTVPPPRARSRPAPPRRSWPKRSPPSRASARSSTPRPPTRCPPSGRRRSRPSAPAGTPYRRPRRCLPHCPAGPGASSREWSAPSWWPPSAWPAGSSPTP